MQVTNRTLCLTQTTLLAASLIATSAVQSEEQSRGCLYATYVGSEHTPVIPCADADPLNIGQDADVQRAMGILGIKPEMIRFRGCPHHRFSAAQEYTERPEDRRYVISYPTEANGRYLAPIVHELGHILQFEMEGGLWALTEKYSSKRIELGADYLAGLTFSHALHDIDINQFQHNILLTGVYVELDFDAHGNPSERGAAFRLGYINFDKAGPDMRSASDHFQRNLYGLVTRY